MSSPSPLSAMRLLTPRQISHIAMIASGYNYAEIGQAHFLSPHTVRHTLNTAREHTGARSLPHLAVMALDAGLLERNGTGYKPVVDERSLE